MSDHNFKPGDRVRVLVACVRRNPWTGVLTERYPAGAEAVVRLRPFASIRLGRTYVCTWIEVPGFPCRSPISRVPGCWRIQTKYLRKLLPPPKMTTWTRLVRAIGTDPRKPVKVRRRSTARAALVGLLLAAGCATAPLAPPETAVQRIAGAEWEPAPGVTPCAAADIKWVTLPWPIPSGYEANVEFATCTVYSGYTEAQAQQVGVYGPKWERYESVWDHERRHLLLALRHPVRTEVVPYPWGPEDRLNRFALEGVMRGGRP